MYIASLFIFAKENFTLTNDFGMIRSHTHMRTWYFAERVIRAILNKEMHGSLESFVSFA